MGGCRRLAEVGAGFLQAQTCCEFQPQPCPTPASRSWVPKAWDSPRGLDKGSSAGGSEGDGPKNGARLMVPTASSRESSSWSEDQRTQPALIRSPCNLVPPQLHPQQHAPHHQPWPPRTAHLEFQGRPDGQAPVKGKSEDKEV